MNQEQIVVLTNLAKRSEVVAEQSLGMEVGLNMGTLTDTRLSVLLGELQKRGFIARKDSEDIISGILITKKGLQALLTELTALQGGQAELSKTILFIKYRYNSYPWHAESEEA